jgi:hypothetical protein
LDKTSRVFGKTHGVFGQNLGRFGRRVKGGEPPGLSRQEKCTGFLGKTWGVLGGASRGGAAGAVLAGKTPGDSGKTYGIFGKNIRSFWAKPQTFFEKRTGFLGKT